MDGDALYGPRTVYTTTNTNGTENESLSYSVPDGKIIEVIVEAHGCRDNDASNRYRCLIRKMFFSVGGTITADLSTDVNEFNNGFGAAGDVTGVTLIESGGLLLLAITSTTTNTIRHAINFYVRELSHTET